MKPLTHLTAALLLTAATGVCAQTVFRCGNTYSQKPCPDGKAVDVTDTRSLQQRKERAESARREKQAADKLEQARLKEEAAVQRALDQTAKAERAAEKSQAQADKKKTAPSNNKIPAYRVPASTSNK